MTVFDHNELDDLIHGRTRLGIMAFLSTAEEADFVSMRRALKLSDGNLSTQIAKLEEAGYVRTKKRFVDKRPQTTVLLTPNGRKAYMAYLDQLKQLIEKAIADNTLFLHSYRETQSRMHSMSSEAK